MDEQRQLTKPKICLYGVNAGSDLRDDGLDRCLDLRLDFRNVGLARLKPLATLRDAQTGRRDIRGVDASQGLNLCGGRSKRASQTRHSGLISDGGRERVGIRAEGIVGGGYIGIVRVGAGLQVVDEAENRRVRRVGERGSAVTLDDCIRPRRSTQSRADEAGEAE